MPQLKLAIAAILAAAAPAQAVSLSLLPAADTSIYKESSGNSNGAGPGLYSGNAATSANETRRALLRFDLSLIPPGSLVRTSSLTMTVARTTALDMNVSLHRVIQAWGESTSSGSGQGAPAAVGDATWTSRFVAATPIPSDPWLTPGGSYVSAPSATTSVGITGTSPVWMSATLASDVDAWMTSPAANFGWIVINNESVARTAKEFGSREGLANERPHLDLNFRVGGDTSNDDLVDFTDLLTLAQNYGAQSGATFDTGDFTRDGMVGFDDLLILAQNYNFGVFQAAPSSFESDWATAQITVPEPMATGLFAVISLALGRRRRPAWRWEIINARSAPSKVDGYIYCSNFAADLPPSSPRTQSRTPPAVVQIVRNGLFRGCRQRI